MIALASQRVRLATIIFTLVSILLALLLLSLSTVLQSSQKQRLQAREEVFIKLVADSYRRALITDEYAEAQVYAEALLHEPSIKKIMLIDYRNRILVSTSHADIGEPFEREKLATPTWRFKTITNQAGTIGTLAILFSREELAQTTREFRTTASLLALPLLLLVAGFAWLLGRMLSKRLELLTAAAQLVASGQLDVQVAESGNDEIGLLGKTFNTMTDSLRQLFADLSRSETLLAEAQRMAQLGNWELEYTSNALWWSAEVYRLFDLDPEQFTPSYEAFLATIHPDDQAMVHEAFTASVRDNKPYDIVHRLLMSDGRITFLQEQGQTFYDLIGAPLRTAGTVQDITERKLAEFKVREALSEALRFREALDHVHANIYMKDTQSRYLYANQPTLELFGCSAVELVGCDDTRFFPPDTAERIRQVDSHVFLGEQTAEEVDVTDTKGGRVVYWEVKTPIYAEPENKTILGLLGVSTDITERKRAEEDLHKHHGHLEELIKDRTSELQASQLALMNIVDDLNDKTDELEQVNLKLKDIDQLKSMFIASMSHELRTPLNSVIGFSSILLNEWTGPLNDEQKQNIGSVLRSGKHLLSLINDVIDISKVEAGLFEVNRDDFDLAELLTEVKQNFSQKAQDKMLFLTLPELHLKMNTDRRRLLQCLMNLVSNALKYIEQGGVRVDIQQDTAGDKVTIRVIDTGIGIAAEDQARLFQAFSRIPSALSNSVQGTGLGLYLTKKIIMEILQGTISVTSEPQNGSTFSITIPCRMDGESTEQQVPVEGKSV